HSQHQHVVRICALLDHKAHCSFFLVTWFHFHLSNSRPVPTRLVPTLPVRTRPGVGRAEDFFDRPALWGQAGKYP
ncbi:unnamed protein product, partial [Closterium sp. Yama58-4]